MGLADAVGRGEAFVVVAVGPRSELKLEALAVRGDLLDFFVAEDRAEVVQRRAVSDPGAKQARVVVGDQGVGAVAAPALADLTEVLKDRQDLDALAGSGRGDLGEVG